MDSSVRALERQYRAAHPIQEATSQGSDFALWLPNPEQLEADPERSWTRDPVILAEAKSTPEVHG